MEEESIIVFNPVGVNPDDFKKKYPELEQISEFKPIKSRELCFVWWFSNPTSYLTLQYQDKAERVLESAKKCFNNDFSARAFADSFNNRKLPNQTKLEESIRRMEKILPTIRYQAKEMANQCMNDLKDLLKKPLDFFTDKAGNINTTAYIAVRKSVLAELKDMVEIVENGFGVSSKEDVKISGQSLIGNRLKNRANN